MVLSLKVEMTTQTRTIGGLQHFCFHNGESFVVHVDYDSINGDLKMRCIAFKLNVACFWLTQIPALIQSLPGAMWGKQTPIVSCPISTFVCYCNKMQESSFCFPTVLFFHYLLLKPFKFSSGSASPQNTNNKNTLMNT